MKTVRLADLGKIITGNTPSKSNKENYNSKDIKFFKPSDFNEKDITILKNAEEYISENARSKARILPAKSILITCIGTIGKVGILEEEATCNQQINAIIPNDNINARYLAYLLLSKKQYMQKKANAPVVPIINKTDFSKIEVDIVEHYEEQVEIANKLDKIQEIINIREEQIRQLEELVKARFVELFGEVGTDTKGWGLKRLGDCCAINPKKSEDKRLHQDLMVSFVPMPAVSEKGEIDASEMKSYNDVKTGFTYFAEQDVLFAKITPCMENGKGAVARGLCNGIGFGSTEFHVLRPVEGVSNPYWLYNVTAFKQFRIDAASNMTGSAGQRRVPASFLEAYKVSLPPIDLQNQFSAFVEQTDKSKLEYEKNLEEMQNLMKSLMSQYFG